VFTPRVHLRNVALPGSTVLSIKRENDLGRPLPQIVPGSCKNLESWKMTSLCYDVAYSDDRSITGTCSHQHRTVASAVACMLSARDYVIAYENGVVRALNAREEAEYEYAVHGGKLSRRTISLLFFLLLYRNASEPQS
jgi:hypothetical protein